MIENLTLSHATDYGCDRARERLLQDWYSENRRPLPRFAFYPILFPSSDDPSVKLLPVSRTITQ
jgi:hypothetical protein